ncbi:MAG: aminotransferase class V-fold PLP-dependent enzyme [Clostridia bacterium]|nr:aminotransferase class V-fold PLP-dependent enzyme [Clostridia bacterium]
MDQLRAQFPVYQTKTYMESAFHNGGCLAAKAGMDLYFETAFSGELAGKRQWQEATDETRILTNALIGGASPENIAFTKNTVEGLNLIARAFPWQPGDNIILNNQEHTSNLMPWLALKEIGVEIRMVQAEGYALPVESFEKMIDNRTRMIAVSHVQASTGYTCDLAALGALCKEKGIFLVVDAIQSLGLLPFHAESWGIDAVSAGGHKGLLAVPGIGILYTSPALLEKLSPAHVGSSAAWTIDRDVWENRCTDLHHACKLEQSNLNYPGIYALREGLKLIESVGIKQICRHIKNLSAQLYDGLSTIGFYLVTPEDPRHRAGIVSVSVPDPDHMKKWMGEHGIAVSRMDAGFVRFSLGAPSNTQDVDRALAAAKIYFDIFLSSK